jgi:hypothetical protein
MTECARFERKVITTAQVDPGSAFVGSSPSAGDFYGTGVVLPAAPTLSPHNRYLVRLCGVSVDTNSRCIIRSIRQLLTIGTEIESGTPGVTIPIELDVESPTWSFVNGNVSWHLRMVNPRVPSTTRTFPDVPGFTPPFSSSLAGITSCILARQQTPYQSLNRGVPYGDPVRGLGTFRDMRFPWSQSSEPAAIGIEVRGPGELVLFASVYQPDPELRPAPPAPLPDLDVLRPEDKFVLSYPNARYWRVGAELIVDLCNPTE